MLQTIFSAWGIHLPHSNLYIPEQYFSDDYLDDFYAEPYTIPFNHPFITLPYNGLKMPPQPPIWWSDFDSLGPLAIEQTNIESYEQFRDWPNTLAMEPVIDPGLTDTERDSILSESKRVNAIMAYMTGINFADEQIGRVITALEAYPDIYNNTIIVYTSDHGFSLGEKKHWGKSNLWETDIRVPLIIADLRNINPQECKAEVSLLDIFPTLCDYAEIAYPVFPDTTPYLNGASLLPLINDAELNWERPSNTQIKNSMFSDKCFIQHSIRDERFHLIHYQSNALIGETGCNELTSFAEQELYDIGVDYETDPNEWNNLIGDSAYKPIVTYLTQWLPDSSNFFKKVYSVSMLNNTEHCAVDHADDTLQLSIVMYAAEGNLIVSPEIDHTIKWKTNLTDEVYFGESAEIPLNSISEIVFDSADHIFIYVYVYDSLEAWMGFDFQQIQLHPFESPEIYFSAAISDTFTITINDYSITGAYDSAWWDMGDGMILDFIPTTHTYDGEGNFTITNYATFGDAVPLCLTSFSQTITIDTINVPDTTIAINENIVEINCLISPNPAFNLIQINLSENIADPIIEIFNSMGEMVYSKKYTGKKNALLIGDLSVAAGNYFIKVKSEQYVFYNKIIVLK